MSTTAVLVSIGILGLAIAVAIQSAAEGGCAGAGMGFVGTIALSALCIAGFRAGGCHGCSTDGAAEERLHDGGSGGKQAPAKKSLFRSGSKTEKLRAFALAEAPAAWETYQVLAGEVELQSKRLEKLRKEMSECRAPSNSTYGSSTARLFPPRRALRSETCGRSAPRLRRS